MNIKGLRLDRIRLGGGVCLYLRGSINHINRSNLVLNNEIEAICVEIRKPNDKPFVVLACYGPPHSNVDHFFSVYESIIRILDIEGKDIYVLGDLNCNLLSEYDSHPTSTLKSIN